MSTILIRLLFAATLLLASGGTATAACTGDAHRQFDFWIGEWEVRTPDGKLAGHNHISAEYDGCVLHERYRGASGFTGESLNMFDASRHVWHQTWVDNSGTLLLLEGGLRDGAMVLSGHAKRTDDVDVEHRISWTLQDDGGVRQHWQTRESGGEWNTVFDGLYTRKMNEGRPRVTPGN